MACCLLRKVFHCLHAAPNSLALLPVCSRVCYFLSAPKCSPCTGAHCCALLRQDGSILAWSCHVPSTGQTETEKFSTSCPFVWLLAEPSRAGGMASFWFCSTVWGKQRFGWKKSKARPRGRAHASLSILENKDPLARCRMPFSEAGVCGTWDKVFGGITSFHSNIDFSPKPLVKISAIQGRAALSSFTGFTVTAEGKAGPREASGPEKAVLRSYCQNGSKLFQGAPQSLAWVA